MCFFFSGSKNGADLFFVEKMVAFLGIILMLIFADLVSRGRSVGTMYNPVV